MTGWTDPLSRLSGRARLLVSGLLAAGLVLGGLSMSDLGTGAHARPEAPPAAASADAVPAASTWSAGPPRAQGCCQVYPYDGAWTFVRIQTASGYGGGFRYRGGWSHDYPSADINMSTIMRELTYVDARARPMGGSVLTFDDPRLMQFPFAYVSEPDEWSVTESEARGLREYLLKGGFVVFDDFFGYEMANLHRQMKYVFPELSYIRLDGTEEIWDAFYRLDAPNIDLQGPNKNGTPEFWGLFIDNDKSKRMLSIANAQADIGDLWEWAAEGWYPLDPTNDAFKMGVNYIVYALTH